MTARKPLFDRNNNDEWTDEANNLFNTLRGLIEPALRKYLDQYSPRDIAYILEAVTEEITLMYLIQAAMDDAEKKKNAQ